jgi:hypothetical protein
MEVCQLFGRINFVLHPDEALLHFVRHLEKVCGVQKCNDGYVEYEKYYIAVALIFLRLTHLKTYIARCDVVRHSVNTSVSHLKMCLWSCMECMTHRKFTLTLCVTFQFKSELRRNGEKASKSWNKWNGVTPLKSFIFFLAELDRREWTESATKHTQTFWFAFHCKRVSRDLQPTNQNASSMSDHVVVNCFFSTVCFGVFFHSLFLIFFLFSQISSFSLLNVLLFISLHNFLSFVLWLFHFVFLSITTYMYIPVANPTTFEFTATTPAFVVGYNVFQSKKSCFKNALGYPWRCKFLQRWRCKS